MTEIKLYNTMSRRKEVFTPLDADNVRMYVCGPTVYDRAHIGNARPVVVFDVLYRLLRHVYGADHVTYVRNFTDIDDKIMARAKETGRNIGEITEETIGWFLDDMKALGNDEPTFMPRATAYVRQMVAMITELIAKGFAYEAEGHVLFDVGSYDGYGKLSNRALDEMIEGARVEVAPYKRNAMDFVLWKPSGSDQPGWKSPWGRGRPGWHIECSAMAKELLGEKFDIHSGGIDLAFPHHENERAQSNCAHGHDRMAQVWMHNGFLQVEGRKMAKSEGNFLTVKDLRDKGVPGEVMRFVLLSTHYRKPLDWTEWKVAEANRTLMAWKHLVDQFRDDVYNSAGKSLVAPEIAVAVADDLNTPKAIRHMHDLAKEARKGSSRAAISLAGSLYFFGFDWENIWDGSFGFSLDATLIEKETEQLIKALLEERNEAKSQKDFKKADNIRNRLEASGLALRDGPDGTTWDFLDTFDAAKLEALK